MQKAFLFACVHQDWSHISSSPSRLSRIPFSGKTFSKCLKLVEMDSADVYSRREASIMHCKEVHHICYGHMILHSGMV